MRHATGAEPGGATAFQFNLCVLGQALHLIARGMSHATGRRMPWWDVRVDLSHRTADTYPYEVRTPFRHRSRGGYKIVSPSMVGLK